MSTRQSVKMKGRNLDVLKRLPIKSTADITKEELEPEQVTAASAAHNFRSTIPTPPIRQVEDYDKRQFKKFEPPKYYIKCMLNSGALNFTDGVMYDIQDDDIKWLKEFNVTHALKLGTITEDHFAKVIEVYELESWKVMYPDLVVDPNLRFPLDEALEHGQALGLGISDSYLREIYLYWRRKRMHLGHALIRAFQASPAAENTSPHVAFRQRMQGRRASHRHPKKNDGLAYQKMRVLSQGFSMVSNILADTRLRERLKNEENLMEIEICDGNLLATPYAQYLRNSILAKDTQLDDIIIPSTHPGIIIGEESVPVKLAATEAKLAALFCSTLPRPTFGLPGCDIEPVRHDVYHPNHKDHVSAPQRRIRAAEPKPRAPVQTSGQPLRVQNLTCNSSSEELSECEDDHQFMEYLRNSEVLQRQMITKDMVSKRGHTVAAALLKNISFYGNAKPGAPEYNDAKEQDLHEVKTQKQQMVATEYLNIRGQNTALRVNEAEKQLTKTLGLDYLMASPNSSTVVPVTEEPQKSYPEKVLRWARQLAEHHDWVHPVISTIQICASLYGSMNLEAAQREQVRAQSERAFEAVAKEVTLPPATSMLVLEECLLRNLTVMIPNKIVVSSKAIPYEFVPVIPLSSLLITPSLMIHNGHAIELAQLADARSKYKRNIISDPILHPTGITESVYWDDVQQRLCYIDTSVSNNTSKNEDDNTMNDATSNNTHETQQYAKMRFCAFQPCLLQGSYTAPQKPNLSSAHTTLVKDLLAPYMKPMVKETMLTQCIKAVSSICADLTPREVAFTNPTNQAILAAKEKELALLQIWLHACDNSQASIPKSDIHVDVRDLKANILEPDEDKNDVESEDEDKELMEVPQFFDDIEFLRSHHISCSCTPFGTCKDVMVGARKAFRDMQMSEIALNYCKSPTYDLATSLFLMADGQMVCGEALNNYMTAACKYAVATNQLYSYRNIPMASILGNLFTRDRLDLQIPQPANLKSENGVETYSLVNMNRYDLDNPLILKAIAQNEECGRASAYQGVDLNSSSEYKKSSWLYHNILHSKVDVQSRQLAVLNFEEPKQKYLPKLSHRQVLKSLDRMQKNNIPGVVVTRSREPMPNMHHTVVACNFANPNLANEAASVHESSVYENMPVSSRPSQYHTQKPPYVRANKCDSKNTLTLLENCVPQLSKDTFTAQGSMEPKALLKLPHEVSQNTILAKQKTSIIKQYQHQVTLNGLKISGMVNSQTIVTGEKNKLRKKLGQSQVDLQESWRPSLEHVQSRELTQVNMDTLSPSLQQSKKHIDTLLHGVVDVQQTLPKVHFEDSGLQRNCDISSGLVDTARLEHTHKVLHAAMAFANTLQSNTESQKIDAKVRSMTLLKSVQNAPVELSSEDKAVAAHQHRKGRGEDTEQLTKDVAVDGTSIFEALDPTSKEEQIEQILLRMEHDQVLSESNHVDAGAKESDIGNVSVFNTATDQSIISHSDALSGRFSTRVGRNGRLIWDVVKFRPSKAIAEAPVSLNPLDAVLQNDIEKALQQQEVPIWYGNSNGPRILNCPTWQCEGECTCKDLPIIQALKRRKIENAVKKKSGKAVDYVINKKMAKQHIFAQITKLDSDVKTMYSHNYHDEYALLQDPSTIK